MTKEALLQILADCARVEPEAAHIAADQALLEFINDPEINAAFEAIERYYA